MEVVRLLAIACSLLCLVLAVENVGAKMPVTFGTAISQGWFTGTAETPLFSSTNGPGMITYLWLTEGNDAVGFGETVLRFYVDNDDPFEATLDMLAGIGFDDNQAPWGHQLFGKGASTGAIYTTLRIPFQQKIKITGRLSANTGKTFWWIVRGVTNTPVMIGGVNLPNHAKLRLYANTTTLQPLQYVSLVDTPNAGAVWMTVLAVQSANLNYLEGCVRAYIQGSSSPMLISSGTEDYFQSAFYFDAGEFHFPEAGFTHWDSTSNTLSAYKVHDRDMLFFDAGGYVLTWRNGDVTASNGQKCADKGSTNGNPQVSQVVVNTWVYEW